jgi:hypothetical protein
MLAALVQCDTVGIAPSHTYTIVIDHLSNSTSQNKNLLYELHVPQGTHSCLIIEPVKKRLSLAQL